MGNEMKSVMLEPVDLEYAKGFLVQAEAYKTTIFELSEKAYAMQTEAWGYIYKKFPELKGKPCNLNRETGEITELEEKDHK